MLATHALRLVLDRGAPHKAVFELLDQRLVQAVAKVLDAALAVAQHDGLFVIGQLTARLGVYSDKVEVAPHLLQEVVKVPLVVGRDGHAVRDLVDDVELLDGDLVDLVQDVDAGDVHAVALDDINKLVLGRVALERNVRIVDAVLGEDGLDEVGVQVRCGHGAGEVDAAFLLFLQRDIGRLLVQPDAKAFQLILDDGFVPQRLQHVQHNEDEVASPRDCNDLATTTFAVLGTLNDTRQVEELDLGALVADDTRHRRQRGELVGSHLRVHTSKVGQQRRFADRWEPDKADTRVARLGHVETFFLVAAAALWRDELAAQLGKLGLEHAKVVARRLVLLRPRHLGLDVGNLLQDAHFRCRLQSKIHGKSPLALPLNPFAHKSRSSEVITHTAAAGEVCSCVCYKHAGPQSHHSSSVTERE
eukprot:m.212348 g.212348  ORF g.212348 m.212348 type:complete len:417 (+) comp20083_c0_seq1:2736-3986(+)